MHILDLVCGPYSDEIFTTLGMLYIYEYKNSYAYMLKNSYAYVLTCYNLSLNHSGFSLLACPGAMATARREQRLGRIQYT